ncbi:MAG: hypothetical protein QG661_2843 [Actinomycetota bacterium]|jgi:hypothetical protein|nr:hypothetical protein [Actinomycetota bacterium]MDQ5975634.1 hypothetical protein [Actinomycetota bacterium]
MRLLPMVVVPLVAACVALAIAALYGVDVTGLLTGHVPTVDRLPVLGPALSQLGGSLHDAVNSPALS